MRKWFAALVAVVLGLVAGVSVHAQDAKPVVVFAAASLTDALTEVGIAFTKQTGIPIKPSFAASSALARQIEAGAPAQVFFPADEEWMDYLQGKNLLAPGSRRDVLANRLVLIAPASSTSSVKISSGDALVKALGTTRIATGDPDSVPVGKYAKAALTKLGAWEQLRARIIPAENVRSALAFVARGEAAYGIVYLTDAKIDQKVKQVDTFPADSHAPIRYPIALIRRNEGDAKRFVEFVSGPAASAIFEKYGFSLAR
jgi:molybdate transport system substrate-binding protein